MKRIFLVTSAAFLAGASAYAQQAPASTASTPASSQSDTGDEIIVTAPADQARIDRRTYTLRNDAVAQSTNMFDVLGHIPSVSVAPSGDITLLGADNVTIQINGQAVPGTNLEQVLRGIPGSNVERIEVITNPSAQYSAQASGGIINIITRHRFDAGLNGTLQASADSLNSYHFGIAPSWSSGHWSFSGQAGVYGGAQENNLHRVHEALPGGDITSEEGQRHFDYHGWYASGLEAAYQATEKDRLSLTLDRGVYTFNQEQHSELSDATGPFSTQHLDAESTNDFSQLTFEFRHEGNQPRALTKLTGVLSRFTAAPIGDYLLTPSGGATNQYATFNDQSTDGGNLALDIEQPLPNDSFLTFGASIDTTDQTIVSSLTPVSGVTPPPFDNRLDGNEQTLAAYATYQFDTGDWTWLPGLRAEQYERDLSSAGLTSDTTDARLFPTLHIRHALTSNLNLDVSYSSRIQRPQLVQLNPVRRFIDVNRAIAGNPNLEPTTTNAYEANLVYQQYGGTFSLTFFDRISEDILSQLTGVASDGVFVTMPVNAGESEQRGLQAILRGPIGEHWRYSLSGNVLNREFDFLDGASLSRHSALEYDGVAQIDYHDADQNAIGADQLQLELRFQGPRHGLQTVIDQFTMVNFTWRRKLTRRIWGVFSAYDIFNAANQVSRVTTADYIERTQFDAPGTRFRLALTYQFGNGPEHPPQDTAPPPPAPL